MEERKISIAVLIVLSIAVWIAGCIYLLVPTVDQWNECWDINERNGGASSGLYCHVTGVMESCEQTDMGGMLCQFGYQKEIAISVIRLALSSALPLLPLMIVLFGLMAGRTKRRANTPPSSQSSGRTFRSQ